MLDQRMRMEILEAVRSSIGKILKEQDEVYLSSKELCKQFQCFTIGWLKTYGASLPRVQTSVVGKDGKVHKGGWAYPKHAIHEMIINNKIRNLMLPDTCQYRSSGNMRAQ